METLRGHSAIRARRRLGYQQNVPSRRGELPAVYSAADGRRVRRALVRGEPVAPGRDAQIAQLLLDLYLDGMWARLSVPLVLAIALPSVVVGLLMSGQGVPVVLAVGLVVGVPLAAYRMWVTHRLRVYRDRTEP